MATETPSRELVEQAQRGDRAAFDELARRYIDRLAAQIRARLGARLRAKVETEDMVQETLARAFRSIPKLRWQGEEALYRWLGSIAEHLIWSTSQKKAWDEIRLSRDVAVSGVSPSRNLRRHERFDRLERAFDGLSSDHREVVRLARIEGLRIREIAARMDRSPDAVKKLLARALLELKRSFGDTESLRLPDRRLGEEESDDDGRERRGQPGSPSDRPI